MPKSIDENVEDIANRIRASGHSSITIQWPEFYTLCGTKRMWSERLEQIRLKSQQKHNLVIGYGQQVVVISHDFNFRPA